MASSPKGGPAIGREGLIPNEARRVAFRRGVSLSSLWGGALFGGHGPKGRRVAMAFATAGASRPMQAIGPVRVRAGVAGSKETLDSYLRPPTPPVGAIAGVGSASINFIVGGKTKQSSAVSGRASGVA